MKEILELMFSTDGTMFVTVIVLLIITIFGYNVLDSLFSNIGKAINRKPKVIIKKVNEFGEEIE